jgi:hypothetical protein
MFCNCMWYRTEGRANVGSSKGTRLERLNCDCDCSICLMDAYIVVRRIDNFESFSLVEFLAMGCLSFLLERLTDTFCSAWQGIARYKS